MGRQAWAQEVANSECVWTMPPICGEFAVKQGVSVEVARGPQVAFDDVAVEVGDHQIRSGKGGVVDAAGLDDDKRLRAGAVNSAGIAKGVRSEAAASDFLVGFENLLA